MLALNLNEIFMFVVFVSVVTNIVITNRICSVVADASSTLSLTAINGSKYFENIKKDNSNFENIANTSICTSVNNDDDASSQHGSGSMPDKERKLRRGKRYLDFVKGTRVSWRTTVKNNILKINTLWGYGFGFRSNFPFPDKADRLRPFFKRDLLHSTIDMLDGHGIDGRACILKSYCMAKLDGGTEIGGGMIFKLLKMLLSARATVIDALKISMAILIVTQNLVQVGSNSQNATVKRGKRFLDILPTTRLFFRVNGKINIIPRPTIWATGYGFRANYPIDVEPKARPFKRDTYELIQEIMDRSGFDGEACLLKAFCTAHVFDEDRKSEFVKHGMLFKLLRYIFTLDHHEKRHFPYLKMNNCHQILHSHCPLSFNSISPYTDDV